jgi:hypothetical protein
MGQAIPQQHPAVVLRTQYNHIRALLAVAVIAVLALTVAIVLVANGDDAPAAASAPPAVAPAYHDEGTSDLAAPRVKAGDLRVPTHEEGTADVTPR